MLKRFQQHLPEYLMEATELALFLVVAGMMSVLFESPYSPVHQAIPNGTLRRILVGLVMGCTAIAHYPENLSPIEGAAIWMQYITAYGALVEYGQIKAGDFVLITTASSSVDYSAIQIAKAQEAIAIATTRSKAKKQMLLDKGADHVIVTSNEDLVSRVMEITNGHGIDLIFDAIAGPILDTLAMVAALGATIFVYGALSSDTGTPFPLFPALQKGLKVQGYTLFEITTNSVKLEHAKQYIYEGLKSRELVPILNRTFTLDQIVEAHRYMESNQQNGKITVATA
jgi:NADPH:quinone reductase-like Zn-dependent oxidoreductase